MTSSGFGVVDYENVTPVLKQTAPISHTAPVNKACSQADVTDAPHAGEIRDGNLGDKKVAEGTATRDPAEAIMHREEAKGTIDEEVSEAMMKGSNKIEVNGITYIVATPKDHYDDCMVVNGIRYVPFSEDKCTHWEQTAYEDEASEDSSKI